MDNNNRKILSEEKTLKRRGLIICLISAAIAVCVYALGLVFARDSGQLNNAAMTVLISSFAMAIITGVIAFILIKRYDKTLKSRKVGEFMQMRKDQTADPEKSAKEAAAKLSKCRKLTYIYTAWIGVIGFAMAFSSGIGVKALGSTTPVISILISAQLMAMTLCRVFMSVTKPDMKDFDTYLPENEYPVLYSIAKKAARDSDCGEDLRICLIADNNVGIGDYKSFILLQIGITYLLDNSEKELYAILLHEFSHVITGKDDKAADYKNKLTMGEADLGFFSPVKALFFLYADTYYMYNYYLYDLSYAVIREAKADLAMSSPEYRDAAASSLIKLFFRGCYDWEAGTYDFEPYYVPEEPDKNLCFSDRREYEKRKEKRRDFWLSLISKEIISMTASHPTTKMRLDALGITEYKTLDDPGSPEYRAEIQKAGEFINSVIYKNEKGGYEDARNDLYLENIKLTDEWKQNGSPLIPEQYHTVINALRALGKCVEANDLCSRAIEELPDEAALYAYEMRGFFKLHSYDDSGIEDLYHAAENNNNYMQEALDAIGRYCCITGNRKELDRYRERFEQMAQKDIDVYSKMNVIKKNDVISEEHLPDGMLDGILEYIRSSDNGSLHRVYLVHKQITEEDATSIFILQYKKDASVTGEVYDKIFHHLDTAYEWQFTLLEASDVPMQKVEAVPGSLVYEAASKE